MFAFCRSYKNHFFFKCSEEHTQYVTFICIHRTMYSSNSLNMFKNAYGAFERVNMLAEKSCMTHRHGCVIIKGSEIVGEGFNRRTDNLEHMFSLHSEVVAISSVKRRSKGYLNNAIMIVVRLGKDGFNFSSPCEHCRKAIKKSGIKKIFYST